MSLKDAYMLANVENIRDLNQVYVDEDQRLMKSGQWDYENLVLLTNQIKEILADIDLNELTEEEREWCQEILWFWYHHAISSAIWRQKSKLDARFHADKALQYQGENHPNKITRLLYLLVHDQLLEAEVWAQQIDDDEKGTAAKLIREYQAGKFFSNIQEEQVQTQFAKPIIKIYLLPAEWDEEDLQTCFNKLVCAARSVPTMRVADENDLIVLFPKDAMLKGLGTEIVIEVDLPTNTAHEDEVASAFCAVMQQLLPNAHVQCKVYPFDMRHGFAASEK